MVKGIIENTYNFIKSNKIYLASWLQQFLQNRHVFWNGESIWYHNSKL